MNKKVKWGLIIVIGLGLIGWGIYSQRPRINEELETTENAASQQSSKKKILNVVRLLKSISWKAHPSRKDKS